MATSGQKLKRALKSAARLPARAVKGGSNSLGSFHVNYIGGGGRNGFSAAPGETPIVLLRLQVVSCTGLLPKDRNGLSDPFVVVSLLQSKHSTPVIKRSLNPVFPAKESTFDFPIYLSVLERMDGIGVVELVVWDRDMLLKKEYLGEVGVGVARWFPLSGSGGDDLGEGERTVGWDDPGNKPFSLALESTRANTAATGSVHIKLGFVRPPGTQNLSNFKEIWTELVRRDREGGRGRVTWVSAPPTEGIGTIRSHLVGGVVAAYEDDGGLSSSCEEDEGESDDEHELEEEDSESALGAASTPTPATGTAVQETMTKKDGDTEKEVHPRPPLLAVDPASPASPATPTQPALPTAMPPSLAKALTPPTPSTAPATSPSMVIPLAVPTPVAPLIATTRSSTGFIPRMKFPRRKQGNRSVSASASSTALTTGSVPVSRSSSVSPASSPGVEGDFGMGAGATSDGLTPLSATTPGTSIGGSATDVEEKGKDKKKRRFRRRWNSASNAPLSPGLEPSGGSASGSGNESAVGLSATAPVTAAKGKKDFMFEAGNDIVGIVMLEIQGAEDLPRLKNMTRTGWDMDPFVVVSFGKKVFRTRVIRHSRNPVWDEKLLFHVRRYETSFKVQLTILDWDKLSSNDHIGDASFDVKTLIECAPQPDEVTGLYASDYGGDHPMREMRLEVLLAKDISWEAKHNPVVTIRAKYQPYAAMRQRFWRQYLTQYDAGDTSTLSQIELTSMLDSLGSTLTRSTIESFFTRYGKKAEEDELTIGEAIKCLETELCRPESEKKRVDVGDETPSVSATPMLMAMDKMGKELALDQLDFSGRPAHPQPQQVVPGFGFGQGAHVAGDEYRIVAPVYTTEPNQVPLEGQVQTPGIVIDSSEDDQEGGAAGVGMGPVVGVGGSPGGLAVGETMEKKLRFRRVRKKKAKSQGMLTPSPSPSPISGSPSGAGTPGGANSNAANYTIPVERVINVKNCPLCHRPRLNSKAEMDIVTHLAVCASQDWNQVDRIVVGNFVTASQAQRKWYTNMFGKISAGDYRLGANSANIIVQNRITGQLEEEKMQVYVRLGIRLLYKGAKGRMEGSRARRLLKSLSIKQGIKYDSPESAKEIPAFIQFHQLDVGEILDPIETFKTFNQFFYRKMKPDARPVEEPDDPYRLVSAADCRLMAFETVNEATKIWVKGREFSVARLLGDAYRNEAENYSGGALAIFRLAPQDYHRFHSPVDGTIGPMTYIAGEYYTVNPQAIRTALDVYGENARKIVPIDSPQFGRVMAVCVGAMMVGSIMTTVEEGDRIRRGQEFGYFAFGGSTIVLLFEKSVVEWDEDLLVNGRASLETLVRVGMGIGRGRRPTLT
ncbi:hypothetical protein AX17_007133 [Amanita inopinata Kibby_2008]|nr:hypothetical protein AX17_007133 [Amanita inopinata Kibby_2008]